MLDEELKKTLKVKQEVEVQSRMKISVADQRMIDHEIKMMDEWDLCGVMSILGGKDFNTCS